MLYRLAVDLTVLIHFGFVLFVVFGALLAWQFPWIKWVHLPALAYGVLIEVFNWYCPLTLLEFHLRREAGLAVYEGSFISTYLNRLIYADVPQSLLILAAALVAVVNVAFYIYLARRDRHL